MTIYYESNENMPLTPEQEAEIAAAAKRPIVFDEDCPEITPEMLKHAYRPGRKRPGDMVTLRVQVMPSTLDKAKSFGDDYMAILGQLLDKAVSEYQTGKNGAV